MAESLSDIGEAIRKAVETYTEAISKVGESLQNIASQSGSPERNQLIENWLRVARMSKDGAVAALERGFDLWEREVRRTAVAVGGSSPKPTNPLEAFAENWRKATEAFTAGGKWGDESRKQAEAIQKTVADGIRSWQRLWDTEKKP